MKNSISRRFIVMMLLFVTLIFAGAVFLLWNSYNTFKHYQSTLNQYQQKQELVSQISTHANQIFFRARGYYAFLNQFEYNELFKEKEQLESTLHAFSKLPLDPQEKEMVQSIQNFMTDFFTNVFPRMSQYAGSGDYESLRKLSSSGINQSVNDLLKYAAQYQKETDELLLQESTQLFEDLSRQGLLFLGFIFMILIISIWVITKATRDIGRPLEHLAAEADRFAKGEPVLLPKRKQEDEIGKLTDSFDFMVRQIQAKEEELTAQNEELQAQQDELMMQQEELQEAVLKMEENERYLEKRNLFIQSLSNTLDKPELLRSIIVHLTKILDAEKGVIVLLNQERSHASFGVSEQGVSQLLGSLEQGPLSRVKETGQLYVVHREANAAERGYHEDGWSVHDLYLPLWNAEKELVACIVLTRLDQTITQQEKQLAASLAQQISLALDKLAMYEETEKQRQITQDMLDTIQEGVQLLNLDGETVQVNRTFRDLFEIGSREAVTWPGFPAFFTWLREKLKHGEQLIDYLEAVLQGDEEKRLAGHVFEWEGTRKRYIQLYAEPLYSKQEMLGTLLVYRDITKEYEIDRMKSEFVSTVSHELRTPLASVLGFAELLLYKELKPERQHRYLSAIYQEANRLTSLINDFLDLQRMESGRQLYDPKKVVMDDLIREVFALQQEHAPRHRLQLDLLTDRLTVTGDREKLRQVLTNLINNAIKYSPDGGTITVTCRSDGQHLIIEVQDDGLGIPSESIPHLFSKFYRVDNSDRREIGGTGLGLAIVQEILKMHNGEIAVTSELGAGSTFSVTLPYHPDQLSKAILQADQQQR
ncbi:ATP-binding protein [Brevibacillus ruminantium]|uniref:histidine kinase n=1 Tax=Brevibacillus ruminantium TaxID=2950604 RepID=A0ABY4WFT0_9BACL|nr:ATP-binding protein [Brevibacillus ruminantium]USG64988.1 ATP-binding protein [Brevibacillus ruminantium]